MNKSLLMLLSLAIMGANIVNARDCGCGCKHKEKPAKETRTECKKWHRCDNLKWKKCEKKETPKKECGCQKRDCKCGGCHKKQETKKV